jgi:hypothetical protein
MQGWAGKAFIFALLLCQVARGSTPALALTLRIYDYAGVPDKALNEAKRQVRRIFTKAGIEARWLDCTAEPPDPGCFQRLQPAGLTIRIVSGRSPSGKGHLFGLAFVPAEGFGEYATIFYGEARAGAQGEEVLEGCILGYALAHEAGHLLLGRQRHGRTGIMSSDWTVQRLRSTVQEFFLFTRSEAERVRSNVRARLIAARP